MLATILNAQRQLPDNWHSDYGLTHARLDALHGPATNRHSFKHPRSETALTLFMLANLDRWKQVGAYPQDGHTLGPRNERNHWSEAFFANIHAQNGHFAYQAVGQWPHLETGIFARNGLNWSAATIVFEFEVLNSAFHTVRGEVFRHLSFLQIPDNQTWSAFDAFMVVPSSDSNKSKKGTLIGFEAKLESDASLGTSKFSYVNQIMRNLEAGYWLTHDQNSLYFRWNFHYVFLCPRRDFEFKSTYYAWLLWDESSRRDAVEKYRKILALYDAAVDQSHFEAFSRIVCDEVTVLHWDQIAAVLRKGNNLFFDNYRQALQEHPECQGVLTATQNRFERAGIEFA